MLFNVLSSSRSSIGKPWLVGAGVRGLCASVLCGLGVFSGVAAANTSWRPLDPDNVLLIDTSKGRIVIEMRPDMAPLAVARVKLLSREGLYDGLQFHRVIPDFVAQTGNPNNQDGGASAHPNLPPEFVFKLALQGGENLAARASDATQGFLGSVPFQGTPIKSGPAGAVQTIRAWGAYCAGVAGMGRQEDKGSANSELFFMLQAARRLDRDYTVWGRVILGWEVLTTIAPGEPPSRPDTMTTVRVLADLPVATRPTVSVMAGRRFQAAIARARRERGADFSVCDVTVPARIKAHGAPAKVPAPTSI